jgi:hypothetical protein
MLLPYILTNGAMDDDDIGILESGNGIPDIIDEARDEVDFFLSLRNGRGYSHGLSNPDKNNILYQAGNTPLAAWASAVNSAMLAEAFRISGHADLMKEYTDSALVAFNYANALSDPWLGYKLSIGEGLIKGRDLKMTAAAFLYNLTGYTEYEDIMHKYNVVSSSASSVMDFSFNQLYAASAYLTTPRTVNYPDMHSNMKASVIRDAKIREANYSAKRPSRRSVDNGNGYFHTVQNVYRTILAHAIADNQQEKDYFLNTMTLEADWGLGRNPLNMIQMTTATTPLAAKRSVENCYTSGRNDGSPGLHPGHTPYLNMDGWACGMTMGCPPSLHKMSYPKGVDTWPRGELYFNTRYVWAHSEFTPHQTMRGKQALYGYLYGLSKQSVTVADSAHSSNNPYDEYYKIMGRSDLNIEGGPVLFYAGSSIHVRFEGTSVSASFMDYNSRKSQKIGFIIDKGSPVVKSLEKNTSNTFKIAENLNDSIHDLIIYKMEGPGAGVFGLQFKGLTLDADKGILPVKTKSAYKLEFYGDSFTAGGGADCTGDNGDCGQNNGFNSYANVCARLINAEVYNNGISGLSVMDNTGWYQSKTTGLQSTYNKLDPSTENASGFTEWDFNRYTPGIVVFGFGINDSYGGGDPFGNPDQWKEAYKEIVKNVVDNYGKENTRIIIHPANIWNDAYTYGPEVVSELKEEGYDAYWFKFSFDLDAHPSKEQAHKMGEELAEFIMGIEYSSSRRFYRLSVLYGTGSGYYYKDTEVNISAYPNSSGAKFKEWDGDVEYLTNPADSATIAVLPGRSISVTAKYETDDTTSSKKEDALNTQKLNIIPNPAADYFTLNLLPNFYGGNIKIIDPLGKVILKKTIDQELMRVNTNTFSKGVYLVIVSNDGKILSERLVVI